MSGYNVEQHHHKTGGQLTVTTQFGQDNLNRRLLPALLHSCSSAVGSTSSGVTQSIEQFAHAIECRRVAFGRQVTNLLVSRLLHGRLSPLTIDGRFDGGRQKAALSKVVYYISGVTVARGGFDLALH